MPYVGARSPEALGITVATTGGIDLSEVTTADITTKNPKGTALSWVWSVNNATASELYLLHTFSSDGNDAKTDGTYVVSGWLLAGSQRVARIDPVKIQFKKYG